MDKTIYKEDSIKSISPREFTRLHPGTYAGSTEYSTQLLKELFANALDEHNIGHGNEIRVTYNTALNIYTVGDDGQGFPINSKREDGETVLQAAFDVLNTSGKYEENGVYGASALGLNGIGGKLVCYLSNFVEVVSSDGSGKAEHLWFKDGIFEKRLIEKVDKKKHGTLIKYQPDPQFFTNKEINVTECKELFKEISALCPTLTIKFYIDDKEIVYHCINGIEDLINEKVKDKEIINRFVCHLEKNDNLFDICLTYTNDYSENIVSYVNYGKTDSGVHLTTLKSNLTRTFNKYAAEAGLFKKNDSNLSGQELSEGLVIVCNLKASGVSYDSQSKTRVVGIDRELINIGINERFASWLETNPKDAKIIIEKALTARKAREAAKKAKDKVREQGKKKEKALKFNSKLADCYSKKRSECEIYVTEGDSASGNLKTARNNEFQAVMPIRGKILNTQKATIEQIQKNAEIMTMIEAFGLKIDLKTMKITYNKEDLRYGKIIIMSDGDVDGAHIKNLFYTFIWNFCPDLIKDGYIYAGVPPLYKITLGKQYYYLKDDNALEQFKKKNVGKKYLVNRFKGLGELDTDETEETLTDVNNRIIKQITVKDIENTNKLFEDLMGSGVLARKAYVKEHSQEATYNAE